LGRSPGSRLAYNADQDARGRGTHGIKGELVEEVVATVIVSQSVASESKGNQSTGEKKGCQLHDGARGIPASNGFRGQVKEIIPEGRESSYLIEL